MANTGDARKLRAEHRLEVPGGARRSVPFPGEIRMKLTNIDGRQMYEVEGYATVFDRGYEMWDMFGSYTEIVDYNALDKSLINNPDVAFLVNHRGVTMARTTNQSLTLAKDSTGLAVHAYLNADRQDVRDLASAIRDGLISEMSFAFALNGGEWSEDYETYTITEADIDRGDVSAVNYGANPYTSIEARSAEWLRDIKRMPVPVARAAFQRITTRLADLGGVDLSDIASWEVVDETGPEKATADRPAMKERATEADDDPASLAQAVDAVLDEAIKLLSGVDVESLPPDVQQAIALITGADTIIDELLEVTGVPDPDDVEVEARAGGKSLNLWRLRVEQSARV